MPWYVYSAFFAVAAVVCAWQAWKPIVRLAKGAVNPECWERQGGQSFVKDLLASVVFYNLAMLFAAAGIWAAHLVK